VAERSPATERVAPRARPATRPLLEPGHLLSYTLELRQISSLAGDHIRELHESAGCWYHDAAARDAAESAGQCRLAAELQRRMLAREHRIFRATEALCASYARASLLLFPDERLDARMRKQEAVARRDRRVERGRLLRAAVGIDDGHPIADRRFRDDWMRHDEQLDEQLLKGTRLMSQCFARMGEVPVEQRPLYIRLFEIDPPEVVLHLRGRARSLDAVAQALLDIAARLRRDERAPIALEDGFSQGR
jgi:hypothetical protein